MFSLWQSPKVFIRFILSVIISGDSPFHLLEMVVLITLKDTMTQTRMEVGRVTLHSKGPMGSQYICFMEKSEVFICFLFFQIIFLKTHSLFP